MRLLKIFAHTLNNFEYCSLLLRRFRLEREMASGSFYIMEFLFYQWKSQALRVKGFTIEFSPFKYNLSLTLF